MNIGCFPRSSLMTAAMQSQTRQAARQWDHEIDGENKGRLLTLNNIV